MKKLMLVAGGLIAANAAANLSYDAVKASGGTVAGALWLALPTVLFPAPLRFLGMAGVSRS